MSASRVTSAAGKSQVQAGGRRGLSDSRPPTPASRGSLPREGPWTPDLEDSQPGRDAAAWPRGRRAGPAPGSSANAATSGSTVSSPPSTPPPLPLSPHCLRSAPFSIRDTGPPGLSLGTSRLGLNQQWRPARSPLLAKRPRPVPPCTRCPAKGPLPWSSVPPLRPGDNRLTRAPFEG